MQELYNHNSLFRKKYFENLSNRFIHASLAIEDMYGNLNDTSQALKLYFQSQALEYAFDIDTKEKLTINNIKEIERILTNEQYDNFRTTKVEVNGSKLERAKPQYIYMEMCERSDNKKALKVLEWLMNKEAEMGLVDIFNMQILKEIKRAKKEEKEEIAIKMKENNISDEMIKKITGINMKNVD